jgi:hypothetical protein
MAVKRMDEHQANLVLERRKADWAKINDHAVQ